MNPSLDLPNPDERLALTPAGVLQAFASAEPEPAHAIYQSVLATPVLPTFTEWSGRSAQHMQAMRDGLASGWLHLVARGLPAPDVRLHEGLSLVIASLSGMRRVALASNGGFCVAHFGWSLAESELLCGASADYAEFARRQRQRGWNAPSKLVSFHQDATMLMPSISYVPFWVDGVDYCLAIGGEPMLNNPALVELIWGIKAAGQRFTGPSSQGMPP